MVGQDTSYFFVAVSCAVTVVDAEKDTNSTAKTYRFVYDTMQLSGRDPAKGLGTIKTNMRFIFMWVVAPIIIGLIIFLLALKYCFRQVKAIPHSELV